MVRQEKVEVEALAQDDVEPIDDGPDRVRGLWEALAYLETEAMRVGGQEISVLIGCARESLERRWGGHPPPEPGWPSPLH